MKPILLVVSPYYEDISTMLVSGATRAIYEAEHTAEMITVPGALEIPAAIAMAAKTGRYAAYVALGCVIRGETYHFEVVSNESARALQDLSIHQHLPIGNGILTVDSMAQATARADTAQGNKGGDAARAALRMLGIAEVFGVQPL